MTDESADAVERIMAIECEHGGYHEVYGMFHGGDPRLFSPDQEDNTPEELAAHKAACEAWDRGEGKDRGPACATRGDGSIYDGTGFGMGVSTYPCDAGEQRRLAITAEITAAYERGLQAEQERSCARLGALVGIHKEAKRWAEREEGIGFKRIVDHVAAFTDTTGCTHQERSERYREALEQARDWLTLHGEHLRSCPQSESAWGQDRKPCTCGLSSVLDQKG